MSGHYDEMAKAEAVIARFESGAYDEQIGIGPFERALLTKAAGDEPLTAADIHGLSKLGRPDLINTAHDSGRLDAALKPQEN